MDGRGTISLVDLTDLAATRAALRAAAPRRRRGLRGVSEVVANSAFCLGGIFLFGALTRLGLGTPEGALGAASGAGMVAAGLAATVLPAKLRRAHRLRPSLGAAPVRSRRAVA